MTRTTISMPKDMARALAREARRRGTSVSEVARSALAEKLGLRSGKARELPFVGLGRSGKRDTAKRAEKILAEEWRVDRSR